MPLFDIKKIFCMSNILDRMTFMKTFTAKLTEAEKKSLSTLSAMDIRASILKRMKAAFKIVKTDVKVFETSNGFYVEFTVDNYEGQVYGGVASWKKWFKSDLGIDPKMVSGSRTRHNVWGRRTEDYDYVFTIAAGS
jgi:hypothetical protein